MNPSIAGKPRQEPSMSPAPRDGRDLHPQPLCLKPHIQGQEYRQSELCSLIWGWLRAGLYKPGFKSQLYHLLALWPWATLHLSASFTTV